MGLFGPSQQEKLRIHQDRLRNHPIVPENSWRHHMKHRLPEYDDLIAPALQITGRNAGDLDIAAMRSRAHAGTEAVLKGLTDRLQGLEWSDVQIVLGRPDFSMALLSDYLSTCGAGGVVANDKLAELLADGIPDLFVSEIRKGSFDRITDDPRQLARLIGAGATTPPAGDPSVSLPDPGGSENDISQIAFNLLSTCGLSIMCFAPLPLEQLAGQLLQYAPAFRDTDVRGVGVGILRSADNRLWIGFDGQYGSLIVYFGIDDADFNLNEVIKPMSSMPAPTQWGLGIAGAMVPEAAARILTAARPVPLWGLSPFAHHRPADEPPPLAPGITSGLQSLGWQRVGNNGFQLDVLLRRGGTQAIFLSPYDSSSYAVIAPLERSVNGAIPPALQSRSFGHYSVEVIAEMVVLCERVAAEAVDPNRITDAGRTLALYAEQQFAPPPAASPPPPPPPISAPAAPPPISAPAAPPRIHRPSPPVSRGPSAPSLSKGANVSLTKAAPELAAVSVGLGWDASGRSGVEFDIDASAIACDDNGKVLSDNHFVFFNNLRSPDGSIVHTGDNRTGEGDGDDETINVDLYGVPTSIASIVFVVSIHEAVNRRQSFGQIQNAFIRVVDRANGSELTRYDLTGSASTETAMVFGELYRRAGEWKFRAVGQGYDSGLVGVARDYGVNVD